MITQLFLLGHNHRRAVSLVLLLVTLFMLVGLLRLKVDTGIESLIPASDPARIVYQRVARQFGTDNKTIVYIKDKNLWTPEKLAVLEKLQRSIAGIEYVSRVDSLFTLHTIQVKDGRVDSVPVINGVPPTRAAALAAKQRALSNPLYLGNFFSDNGNVTAMIVSLKEGEGEKDVSPLFYQQLKKVLANDRGQFEQLFQVGVPRIDAELKSSLNQDFMLLGPLSALLLVVAILFFMRNGLAAVVPIITAGISIIWTFGMMGWTGLQLNILSAMLPSLIIVIGSTEDIHMMAAYFRGLNVAEGDLKNYAIRYMAGHMGLPLVLTILTTVMGFASNIFSDIVLIRQFAIASTFGLFANGLITVLSMPVLLSLFGPDTRTGLLQNPAQGVPARIMKVFRYSQERFPYAILAVTTVLCGFFIFEASKLYVTNDPLSYFPSDRPLIRQTKLIHDDLAGVKMFFITLDAHQENAFQDPANIAKLKEIQKFLAKQGVYDRSISLADYLSFVNHQFKGGAGSGFSLPQTRQLVAQYLLFFNRSDLDSFVSHDYRSANIIVRHNISDSHTLNQYVNELRGVVASIAGPGIKTHVIGENLMVNRAAETLMVGQLKALFVLLGLIFLIMSVMFTSFKGGAIAMVPAVIPIAMMFGIMGVFKIPLNPGTAMVAVIAIGIAIDGTIHLLARYNELCRRTSDYAGAVRIAAEEEATPLIVSSLALAVGFGILLFSNFTVVQQFGALSAATMLFSIIANLLITPIIMTRVRLVGLYQILAMSVDREVLEKSPLFNHMSDYQRRKAVLISELHEFKEGDLLVEQDTLGRSMYLILSGSVDVVRRDGDQSRLLATLQPGSVFGEIGYIRETRRTADVQARTAVSALRFDYEKLQKDLKFFPNIVAKLNFNISYILGERLADMVERS